MTIESWQWLDRRVNSLQFTNKMITTDRRAVSCATADFVLANGRSIAPFVLAITNFGWRIVFAAGFQTA
jgi:hypothetical protein